jgi:two-component system, chemotaxis family, CheB/CheR fusion protein
MAKSVASARTSVGKAKSKPYPIVAIGASAGGLEAVSELLQNLSPTTGMAFVYIQHLDPTRKSMLSEILQRKTKMKVVEAKHLMHIQPDHLFIIPPNKDMAIIDGVVTLNPRQEKPSIHMSVDKFFNSLAEKQKEGAIGIVLSGNASDGTYGLRSIKQAGGITIAQDDSAKFQSMPRSAIAEGIVDMVLSPKEMAKELERISQHPAMPSIVQDEKLTTPDVDTRDEESLANIIQLLKKATSVDFAHYKMNTIRRRIVRRMLIYKLDTLSDYYNYLKQHPGEITILYQDILINVTSFFRDPDTMEYMKKTLLPKILKTKGDGEQVRVWIPACATGEEAYSLAIIFKEILGDKLRDLQVQIFATDLSEACIARARIGLYSENDLADVSPERVQRYFEKIDGSYRVVKSIRDLCVFANHNIFRDPPFSRLDLVSCCNLMIYLDNVLQKKVLGIFHYALNNNGYLVLGKSETIGSAPQLFTQVEKKFKIFSRKRDTGERAVFDMHYRFGNTSTTKAVMTKNKLTKNETEVTDIEKTVDSILLREFVPASVVINSTMEILQFHGSTGMYLEPSRGKASLNLLKMARPGLSYELRTAVHKAAKSRERVKKTGMQIEVKGQVHHVSIEVIPLPPDADDNLFLVVFEEMVLPVPADNKTGITKDKLVKKLQEDLMAAKEDMRSIIEEQEASVEELQSANEEIISSNEELQSINEELETSKEEVESANEELLTINTELQLRNEQLSESYEYSKAIFETIDEAVLVLDKDFRVKTANQSFYRIFSVNEKETEGMLLFELGNRQWNILKLRELLDEVVSKNKSFNGFEMQHNFPSIGPKIMVLNARRLIQNIHRQQLVILAIRDITAHREAEKIIREQETRFRNMANNAPVMIWTSDASKRFNFVNKTWLNFTARRLDEDLGDGWKDLIHEDDLIPALSIINKTINKKESFTVEYRMRRNDGQYRWVMENGEPNFSPEGQFIGYIGSCVEIHDKKLAQEEMEKLVQLRTKELNKAIEHLNHINEELSQFAYVASHDLQEPLRKIITYTDWLREKHKDWTEKDNEFLQKIISSSQRMRKLINELLNFSKASGPEKEFVNTDLNEVLKNVITDLELLIDEKKAKISVGKFTSIHAIPLQMHQLFYNLISNSLKFSQKERPTEIVISERKLPAKKLKEFINLDQSRTYHEITVKDNGIGFDPQFAEQIFTIFQRLDTSDKYQGTGIGLALSRKIVTNHKGMIYATSEPGKGAEFHIIFPDQQ